VQCWLRNGKQVGYQGQTKAYPLISTGRETKFVIGLYLMGEIQEICQKISNLQNDDGGIEDASPGIHSLPVEILCHIFRMCIPDNHFKRPTHYSAPLLLGRVCKYWKDIAWNEATLWTRPRFSFPSGSTYTKSPLLRSTLEVYQKRSKDADFDLSVNQTSGFNINGATDDLEALLDTLPRCRGLWMSCQERLWLELFNGLSRLVLRRLEYIFIKIHSPSGELRLRNAPRLRAVRLHLVHPGCLSLFTLPYTQLLDLSCVLGRDRSRTSSPAVDAWRSLLVKCPNLRVIEAYFQGYGLDRSNLIRSSIMSAKFDHVRKIIIRLGFRTNLANILNGFSFPIIEELHVIATSHPVCLLPPTVSFFEGLNTTLSYVSRLTSLRLIRVSFASSELQALLQATPLITSLDIMLGAFHPSHARFEIDDENLRFLLTIFDFELHPVIPRLRHLRLYLKVDDDISQDDNAAQYAVVAHSRYRWMSKHAEDHQILKALPSYPFRLYLKYEPNGEDIILAIARGIGSTAFPVLWPERSNCFMKEQ